MKITGNWTEYRKAIHDGFHGRMLNPSIHWTPSRGFFASPNKQLVPLSDDEIEIGDCCYYNSGPSFSGTRDEYLKVKRALKLLMSGEYERWTEAAIEAGVL